MPEPTELPLFPLGSVLFPQLILPLHIFEERYRALVRDLIAVAEAGGTPRFGVLCIRHGREVGADGVRALYEVGCTAVLRQVESYDDGRFDIVTTGVDRFRLLRLTDGDRPYLTAQVELLDDLPGEAGEAAALATGLVEVYRRYLDRMGAIRGQTLEVPEGLPADPSLLGYLVAATVVADTADKQALLAEPEVAGRLRAELRLLRRELAMMTAVPSVPAPELSRVAFGLN